MTIYFTADHIIEADGYIEVLGICAIECGGIVAICYGAYIPMVEFHAGQCLYGQLGIAGHFNNGYRKTEVETNGAGTHSRGGYFGIEWGSGGVGHPNAVYKFIRLILMVVLRHIGFHERQAYAEVEGIASEFARATTNVAACMATIRAIIMVPAAAMATAVPPGVVP